MAQVDTGIYQNLLRPVKSVQEYDQEAQQAEGNKLGLLLQRGQYDAQQRGVADDASYRDAVRGFGADSGANANMLRARGLGKQAMDYEKSALDAGKTAVEVANLKKTGAKTDSDLMDASLKRYRAGLDFIETPQGAVNWLKAQYEDPALSALMNSRGPFEEAIKHIPQTPAEFNQWRDKVAMGIENYSKKLQEDRKIAENERNNKAQNGIAMRGQDITVRGQNMVDARTRESTAQGKAPSGYRQLPDGSLEFIPGGPADPAAAKKAAPTEFQGKSATFGSRAQEADRILQELDGKYSPAGISMKQGLGRAWGVGGVLESAANMGMSSSTQKAEQAQRDFVNAVLRQESGAAIGESEFDNASKQYFPQPGDSKAVIQQKAANRKRATQGLINNAGGATVTPPSAGGASGGWGDGWSIEEVK